MGVKQRMRKIPDTAQILARFVSRCVASRLLPVMRSAADLRCDELLRDPTSRHDILC